MCLFKIEAKGILECGRKRNEPLMHVFMQKYYCGRGPSPLAWSGVVIAWSFGLVSEIKMHTHINWLIEVGYCRYLVIYEYLLDSFSFKKFLLHCGNSQNVLINSMPAAFISLSDTWILGFNVVYLCKHFMHVEGGWRVLCRCWMVYMYFNDVLDSMSSFFQWE